MKLKRTFPVTLALLLAICLAITVSAGDMPTEPIGGKPPEDTKASFTNFDTFKDQVLYQRAFEAVLWSVPMVNKLGLRRGTLAIGGGENVVLAWSAGANAEVRGSDTEQCLALCACDDRPSKRAGRA